MTRWVNRRRVLVGAGAATLLLAGGILAGPVAGLAQSDPQADLSADAAVAIAIAQFPGTSATDVALEEEDGKPIYEVTLSNGVEVEVHGNSSAILETENEDDEGADDDGDEDD